MPVGSKPAGISPYGGLDMLGNVAEWVSGPYARDYYRHSAASNPSGPDTGMDRVLRGSWWMDHLMDLRCAWRHPVTPGFRTDASGFRCVVPTSASAVPSSTATPAPVTTSPSVAAASAMPVQIGQHSYTFEWRGEQLNYLLFLPKDYESEAQKTWPLILFLHGKGQTTRGLAGESRIAVKPDFPFIVLSPQLSTSALNWYAVLDLIDALLDQIVASYRVDAARLYVTGLSMGGEGTYLMVTRKRPDRFAAAVPLAGASAYYLDKSNACIPKDVAFWVFHGDRDTITPVTNSEALVNALKACGADVQYTVFPDVFHDIWWRVYDDPALYPWLLEQTRRGK
jgi:predicted peptidase